MTAPLTSERPQQAEASEQVVQRAGAGPSLPTWAVLASLVVALVAALAFFITGSPDRSVRTDASAPAPDGTAGGVEPSPAPRQDVSGKGDRRGGGRSTTARTATVDVYNNAGVAGLAAATGDDVRALGWAVGTEDNWYGTIPQSTIYYPAALADEARLLAKDLGIQRTRPAVSPMSFQRLSLILTE